MEKKNKSLKYLSTAAGPNKNTEESSVCLKHINAEDTYEGRIANAARGSLAHALMTYSYAVRRCSSIGNERLPPQQLGPQSSATGSEVRVLSAARHGCGRCQRRLDSRPERAAMGLSQHCQATFAARFKIRPFLYVACLASVIASFRIEEASAHGRLIEPPSRASMWRYGFDTPADYNDHASYCGGYTRQWQRNNGKCGICGDAWDTKPPRAHETGGKYGNSVIVRRYRTGAVIPVRVELTANHHGYFEFRTCPMKYRGQEVTQNCLDEYVLKGDNGTVRYYPGEGNRIFEAYYKLPDELTCSQCVFQWRYVAGNNWGDCGDGTGAVGCGPQEEFRACADIAIGDEEATLPPRPRPPKRPTTPSTASVPSSTETSDYSPEYSGPYWLFNLIIAGTCLLVVLAVMALLYTYYYHAGRAKTWLMARRLLTPEQQHQPPVAPPRQKKHYTTTANQMQI